jgi:hypothetical protein
MVNLPTGSTARVKFVSFPTTHEVALLSRGNVIESAGAEINGGPVNPDAFAGPYFYVVELLNGFDVTRLECVWPDGRPSGMGGGIKTGKPPQH